MSSPFSHFKNNALFSVGTASINTKLGSDIDNVQLFKRTVLEPVNQNPINVHGDFDWKNRSDVDEVPAIILRERTLTMGGLARTISNVYDYAKKTVEAAAQGAEDGGAMGSFVAAVGAVSEPYANMYVTAPTGFTYHLPWLLNNGSNLRKITNTWTDEQGNKMSSSGTAGNNQSTGMVGDIIGTAAGIALGAATPGVGMEKIQSFSQTSNFSLNISFPLYNTVSIESAFKNYCFISLITYQNLKNRTSLISYVPPCVYEVESVGGGGVYMPIACVENLSIENIGTTRLLKEFQSFVGDVPLLMPEAYMVNITLRELIPQSSNIFATTMGGRKVRVTSSGESAEQAVRP
jgi:hypothetical protein